MHIRKKEKEKEKNEAKKDGRKQQKMYASSTDSTWGISKPHAKDM